MILHIASSISACMIVVGVGNQNNEGLFSLSWKIGSCTGPKKIFDETNSTSSNKYESNRVYIDMCCLSPETYTLQCSNTNKPYGWGKSFIEIEGQRYCDDFVGYKGLRKVLVEGKQQKSFNISVI